MILLCRCYVWSTASYGSETWTLRELGWKYLENFEMWCWKRMENIKWPEKVTNEQVLDRIGDKKTLLNTILRRKANFIGRIQRCHWRTDDGSERSRKKKNTASRWFEKEKKILGAKGRSWRSKKMETTVYPINIRKKYKLYYIHGPPNKQYT